MTEQFDCYAFDQDDNDVKACCYCMNIVCECAPGDWPNLEDIKEVKDDAKSKNFEK